jgi:hypothetical protein
MKYTKRTPQKKNTGREEKHPQNPKKGGNPNIPT